MPHCLLALIHSLGCSPELTIARAFAPLSSRLSPTILHSTCGRDYRGSLGGERRRNLLRSLTQGRVDLTLPSLAPVADQPVAAAGEPGDRRCVVGGFHHRQRFDPEPAGDR